MSSPTPNPNVPQIPQPIANLGALVTIAQALKQGVDSLAGNRGDPLGRAVTFSDLIGLKLLTAPAAISDTGVGTTVGTSVVYPYLISGFSGPGALSPSQVLLGHCCSVGIVIPPGFGMVGALSSAVGSFVHATSTTVITVQRCPASSDPTVGANWVSVGTASFVAGACTATLSSSGAVVCAAGDFLRFVGPSAPDATLAQIYFNLVGKR